jgi:hypothetical protein
MRYGFAHGMIRSVSAHCRFSFTAQSINNYPELALNLPDRAGITSIIQMLLHPLPGPRSRLPIVNVELFRGHPMPLRYSGGNVQLTSSEMLIIHHELFLTY